MTGAGRDQRLINRLNRLGLAAAALVAVLAMFTGAPRALIGVLGAVASISWLAGLLLLNRMLADMRAGHILHEHDDETPR